MLFRSLGESGSTSHMFFNCGVIHIEKSKIKEEELFEIATNAGAKDLKQVNNIHEIITEKEDFYKIKSKLEQKIEKFLYSQIEWRALNYVKLDNEQSKKMIEIFSVLEELDDVQNVYSNASIIN